MSVEGTSGLPAALTPQKLTFLEISNLLESTNWVNGLSRKEVEALSKYLQVCVADKDAVIVSEGSRDAHLCLVVEGKVRVVKVGDDSASRELGSVGPGKTFGEMSLIDGQPRSASVIAEEKTTLIVLTGDRFAGLGLEVPRLGFKVLLKISTLLSHRLRQTSGILVDHLEG
jgi:CRP/FNR family cyclic AMP-dependent transcriptional regulator